MKKPYHFAEKSTVKCQECNAPIKMNLVARKLTVPRLCYKCWMKLVVIPKRSK